MNSNPVNHMNLFNLENLHVKQIHQVLLLLIDLLESNYLKSREEELKDLYTTNKINRQI
jgi:hypothetical protein